METKWKFRPSLVLEISPQNQCYRGVDRCVTFQMEDEPKDGGGFNMELALHVNTTEGEKMLFER